MLVALVSADGNERLDDLLERYLALLDDDSIVVSLTGLYARSEDQPNIIAFVARQGECSSPSTRKVASDFLKALRR